jgi:hypothetical protein
MAPGICVNLFQASQQASMMLLVIVTASIGQATIAQLLRELFGGIQLRRSGRQHQ